VADAKCTAATRRYLCCLDPVLIGRTLAVTAGNCAPLGNVDPVVAANVSVRLDSATVAVDVGLPVTNAEIEHAGRKVRIRVDHYVATDKLVYYRTRFH